MPEGNWIRSKRLRTHHMPSGTRSAIGIVSDQRTGSIKRSSSTIKRDRRQQEAERIEREGKRREAGDHQQRLGPAGVLPARTEGRAALGDRGDDDRSREQAHQDAGIEQHVAGAGIVDGAELQLEPGPDDEAAERKPDQPAPQFGVVEAEFDVGDHYCILRCGVDSVQIPICIRDARGIATQFVFFASPSWSITLRSESVSSTTNFL